VKLRFFADQCVPLEIIPALGRYLGAQIDRDFFRGKLFIVEVHRVRIRC